jgi:hypothetical protein
MRSLIFVVGMVFSVVSFAESDEASQKRWNDKKIKEWEATKEQRKDDYKQTKNYKKMSADEQNKFDKDWAARRKQLESLKKRKGGASIE